MKRTPKPVLVLVTAPDTEVARRLARMALEARLIACANLVPQLESHYWWQDRIESSQEVMMLLKTTRPCLRALQALVLANHPYDTAEFVVLPLDGGSPRYLDWIVASVTPPPTPARKISARGSS
jgi:periplasmic divalent cation tolerance protein